MVVYVHHPPYVCVCVCHLSFYWANNLVSSRTSLVETHRLYSPLSYTSSFAWLVLTPTSSAIFMSCKHMGDYTFSLLFCLTSHHDSFKFSSGPLTSLSYNNVKGENPVEASAWLFCVYSLHPKSPSAIARLKCVSYPDTSRWVARFSGCFELTSSKPLSAPI